MAKTYHGELDGSGKRFGLVVSRFNELITGKLLGGARDVLLRQGVVEDDLVELWVPGAFELPLAARKLAEKGGLDGIAVLGCLIRGATPHFDYISVACSRSVMKVSEDFGLPVSFGVLTCDTQDQALERAGSKAGNKGVEAAMAMLETCKVIEALAQDQA